MNKKFTITLALGAILALEAHQPVKAALTQPVPSEQQQAQTTPARWAYYPEYAPHYYYYEPVVPEYYYYEPVVPVIPYYYAPDPYFVQPGFSFNITL